MQRLERDGVGGSERNGVLMHVLNPLCVPGWLLAANVAGAAELPAGGLRWGKLLVAGGANFPEWMPWAGGKKKRYDTVYALSEGLLEVPIASCRSEIADGEGEMANG